MLDGAAQSAARSADARQVKAAMQNVSTATSRPGEAGQDPPFTPSLPSLPSTPTRTQPPAEGAPAVAAPGRGSATRVRDTDEEPRREPRQRSPPPEPMQQPDWIKEVAAKLDKAAQAEAASEAPPVRAGDLSAALKMFGAIVLMDCEADAQICARLVGSMPPVQCKDTRRIYHPREWYPTPALTTLTAPATPAASSGAAAPAAPAVPAWGLVHLGEDCPICHEELGAAGDVVQLQCPQPPGAGESAPHLFHLKCITHHAESWGKRGSPHTPGSQASCPTCRAPMVQCRSVRTGKLHPLTAEAEAGQSAAPVTGPADRAALRLLAQLQQDLPQPPPGSARAEMRFGRDYYEGPQPPSRSSARRGTSATARGSPRPAAQSTSPMEVDEPHAAPHPAGEGGAEGAAPSRAPEPDEDVTESDLFSEDGEQQEGGGALSSPPTRALAPSP